MTEGVKAWAKKRLIGHYDFEGGGYVQIVVSGNVDTTTALEMSETLIELKRQELDALAAASTPIEESKQ